MSKMYTIKCAATFVGMMCGLISCQKNLDEESRQDMTWKTNDTDLAVTGNYSDVTYWKVNISGKANVMQVQAYSPVVGVMYSLSDSVDPATSEKIVVQNFTGSGEFEVTLDPLRVETTYYYRTYVIVDKIYYFGDIKHFKTRPVKTDEHMVICEGSNINRKLNADHIAYFPKGKDGVYYVYPDQLLITIADYAFRDCVGLESITIPPTVKKIGRDAFSGCVNLKTVCSSSIEHWLEIEFGTPESNPLYPGSAKWYIGNTLVEKVNIPEGIKKLNRGVFFSDITVNINRYDIQIDQFVFGLACKVSFPSLTEWLNSYPTNNILGSYDRRESGNYKYGPAKLLINGQELKGKIEVPSGITQLKDYAFWGCDKITDVAIPRGVTTIGVMGFANCAGLTEITLTDGITEVKFEAFAGCENLSKINFPESVQSIGDRVLSYCSSLSEIIIKAPNPPQLSGSLMDSHMFIGISSSELERKIFVPKESLQAYKSAAGWANYKDIIYPIE